MTVLECIIESLKLASVLVAALRRLNGLSDDAAARLALVYYADARDALIKALTD